VYKASRIWGNGFTIGGVTEVAELMYVMTLDESWITAIMLAAALSGSIFVLQRKCTKAASN
jgi:hypothetical protein